MKAKVNIGKLPDQTTVSFKEMIKTEGIYRPVRGDKDDDYHDVRILVFLDINKEGYVMISCEDTFEPLLQSCWKNDRFIKTGEELEITFK